MVNYMYTKYVEICVKMGKSLSNKVPLTESCLPYSCLSRKGPFAWVSPDSVPPPVERLFKTSRRDEKGILPQSWCQVTNTALKPSGTKPCTQKAGATENPSNASACSFKSGLPSTLISESAAAG